MEDVDLNAEHFLSLTTLHPILAQTPTYLAGKPWPVAPQ